MRDQYEVGTSTQIELLTAQDALVAGEADVALARVEASIAEIAVRRGEGRLR